MVQLKSDLAHATVQQRLFALVRELSTKEANETSSTSSATNALARDLLLSARDLVERGWCQGTSAASRDGRRVDPWDPLAERWSVIGALIAVWAKWRDTAGSRSAILAFQLGNIALLGAIDDVPQRWNDASGRTLDEVLSALDRAAQLV